MKETTLSDKLYQFLVDTHSTGSFTTIGIAKETNKDPALIRRCFAELHGQGVLLKDSSKRPARYELID